MSNHSSSRSTVDDVLVNHSLQPSIDFKLCVKCQMPGGILVSNPRQESYVKFLEAVRKRAVFGDGDFPAVRYRLHQYNVEDLVGKATWHIECYKDTVHAHKIERAEKAYKRKLSESCEISNVGDNENVDCNAASQRPFTRSASNPFREDKCFFCNEGHEKEVLHEVRSMNMGRQIREVVEMSDNREWQVKLQPLNPDDARAINVKYHLYCYVKHVQRAGTGDVPMVDKDEQIRQLSVDTELCSILKNMLTEGTFVSMDFVREVYEQLMESHSLHKSCTSKEVKTKILQYMSDDVVFSRPYVNRPETICSSASRNAAVRDAAKQNPHQHQDVLAIMKCATIIRRDILAVAAQKWSFDGSLSNEDQHNHVPVTLQMLLKWILQGTSDGAHVRNNDIEKASRRLSQNIMYETKSNRQVSYRAKGDSRRFNHSRFAENEQVLAVAFKVHTYTRSKSLIQYLHKNGHCINYSRLLHLEAGLAKSITDRMVAENGVYVPPQLKKCVPIFFAVDNIDFDEDTPDGKRTMHGTVIVVLQTSSSREPHQVMQVADQSAADNSVATVPANSYLRQLKGSVIPTSSPKYTNYRCNMLKNVQQESTDMDNVWLMSRYIARKDKEVKNQPIPLWAGYNSLLIPDDRPLTTVNTLPLITSPANEYNTLIDVLKQTQQITSTVMGPNSKTIITLDMDLYMRVIKLQSMRPDIYKQFIFRVGEFHTVLCSLRALGSFVENSGIDDAWIQSDIYGPTTCRQILEGKHMKRALDAHITTLQVFFDLTMEMFFAEQTDLHDQLHNMCEQLLTDVPDKRLPKQYATFKSFYESTVSPSLEAFVTHKKTQSNMFKFVSTYMDLVLTLLNFIRASRQGMWLLHLSSLEELCSLFFSQNRLKYAQFIPEYIAKMHELKSSDPSIWQNFMQGNFCVKKSTVAFTSIGVDHAIEHVNRSMKVMGGIRGLTQKPGALSRFFLIAPELARLSQEAESLAGYSESSRTKHHSLSPAATCNQEKRIEKLKLYIRDSNPLEVVGQELMNFSTKSILPAQTTEDIMKTLVAGSEAYQLFMSERIVGNVSLWDKMKKMKLMNWTSTGKTSSVKMHQETIELKENRSLFARLALAAVSRPDIDMADSIGTYEFSCVSRALFAADGSLLPCTGKSQLLNILEAFSQDCSNTGELGLSNVTAVVDAMVVVQELAATAKVKTCKDFADQFLAAIDRRTEHYNTLHIVFDNYTVKNSLEQSTRDKRSTGLQSRAYVCSDNTPIRVSLHNFLSNTSTKHSLTVYLAEKLLEHYDTSSKTCIVSTSDGAKSSHVDVSVLSSNHEEADTMVILHACYAANQQQVVHIMSPDTDVFILALRRLPQIGRETCVISGTGTRRKLVLLQPIYEALGSHVVAALPGFHAFTGCDTTGRFSGKGKQTCWKAFYNASADIIRAFSNLGKDEQPSKEDCAFLEEYVCCLYQRKTKETQLSRLRWHMFKQCQAEAEKLPPTSAALRQHVLRAHYQCMVWNNDTVPTVNLPEPTAYGWFMADGFFKPVVTDLKPAPEAIVGLVRCKCVAGRCHGKCSCSSAGMACTQMCRCEAHPDQCDNADVELHSGAQIESDDSDEEDVTQAEYQFPYQSNYSDGLLAYNSDEVQEEEADNIVYLPAMDVDCVDMLDMSA